MSGLLTNQTSLKSGLQEALSLLGEIHVRSELINPMSFLEAGLERNLSWRFEDQVKLIVLILRSFIFAAAWTPRVSFTPQLGEIR